MNVNWDDMRFFLAVCRSRSFVGAARELKVTHSTVSRRLQGLETSLKTQLFHRTDQGCRLTSSGETLLPYAEQLESTVIQLEGNVAGKDLQLTGSIRVGAPDGLGNYFLAASLARFQKHHPGLDVELIAAPMYHSLSKREIDILITVRKPETGDYIVRKLCDYKLGLFASPKYLENAPPIHTRSDLKQHSIIGYIDDLLFDRELRFNDELLPGITATFRSLSVVAQVHAIEAGAGIGIVPYFMAHPLGSLAQVLPHHSFERSYWLQVNQDTRGLARIRTTMDHIILEIEQALHLFTTAP